MSKESNNTQLTFLESILIEQDTLQKSIAHLTTLIQSDKYSSLNLVEQQLITQQREHLMAYESVLTQLVDVYKASN